MRYSTNLSIIIKAIEKASAHASRDYIELENLQSNPFSANKFANSCYNRVKKILAEDFMYLRPEYNLIFADGEKVIRSANAEYTYIINPIDGLENLSRAHPDFAISVALEQLDENGKREPICAAISKIYGGELYYSEKGFGSYLNSRRIRVSKRTIGSAIVAVSEDEELLSKHLAGKKYSTRSHGCRSLEIAYLAAARFEKALFVKEHVEFLNPLLLFIRESGGKITEEEKFILASA